MNNLFIFTLLILCMSGCSERNWTNIFDLDNTLDPHTWAPLDLTFEQISDNKVKLLWENPDPLIDGFVLDRQKNSGLWVNDYTLSDISMKMWTDTVTLDKTYKYRLMSRAGDSRSAYAEGQITPFFPPPGNLTVENLSSSSVNIHWPAHPYSEFSGYTIEKASFPGLFKNIAIIEPNTQIHMDNTLSMDSIYAYRLWAFTPRNISPCSDTLQIRWEITRFSNRWDNSFSSSVNKVCISPDGLFVYSADDEGILRKHNLLDGTLVWPVSHSKPLSALAVSPDGEFIAAGTRDWSSTTFQIWDKEGWMKISIPHAGTVNKVIFSFDSQKAACCSEDKTIVVWDRGSNTVLWTFNIAEPVYDICFTPDGQKLISTGPDFSVAVWDLNTGSRQNFTGHTGQITAVAVNSSGTLMASGSMDWRTKGWNSMGENLWSHDLSGAVTKVLFFPESDTLLSASEDKVLRCRNGLTGEKIWEGSFSGIIRDIIINKAGDRILVITDDGVLTFMESETGVIIWQQNTGLTLRSLSASDNFNFAAFGETGGKLQCLDGIYEWFSGITPE